MSRIYLYPQPLILKPGLALKQLLIVLYDIIVANLQVALLILGIVSRVCKSHLALARAEWYFVNLNAEQDLGMLGRYQIVSGVATEDKWTT